MYYSGCGTTDLRIFGWLCVRAEPVLDASGSKPGNLFPFYKSFLTNDRTEYSCTNDRTEYSCAVKHVSYLNSLYFPLEIAK